MWSNQDGGFGRLGTILEIDQGPDDCLVRVKWLGLGRAFYYRWGRDGKFDVIYAYVCPLTQCSYTLTYP